jgi:hypothetical protein
MRRTVNHTGRTKITLDLVSLKTSAQSARKTIDISWDLTSLALSPGFDLVAEIDSFAASQRIELGQLREGKGSAELDLEYIRDSNLAKVTLLVVDASQPVRIIKAKTSSMPVIFDLAENADGQLLKIQRLDDLETLWHVDFHSGEPILQVCNRGGLYPKLTNGPLFFAAVLPAAVKEIAFTLFSSLYDIQEEVMEAWLEYFEFLGLSQADMTSLGIGASEFDEDTYAKRLEVSEFISSQFSKSNKFIDLVSEDQ